MNTAELLGVELDYWAGRADGKHPVIRGKKGAPTCLVDWLPYSPSSDWRQAGPLIEREKIMVAWNSDHWIAGVTGDIEGENARICKGPTALIAAMRALVQATFGDSVLDDRFRAVSPPDERQH